MVVDGRRYGWAESTLALTRVDQRRVRRERGAPRAWFVAYWCGIALMGASLTGLGLMVMGAGR